MNKVSLSPWNYVYLIAALSQASGVSTAGKFSVLKSTLETFVAGTYSVGVTSILGFVSSLDPGMFECFERSASGELGFEYYKEEAEVKQQALVGLRKQSDYL
uniref:Uncharacterized protein n=1 Tax=Glossina palpalis gambiensis TaxID=67801 RepID=A0A1B0BAF0_9MUSC